MEIESVIDPEASVYTCKGAGHPYLIVLNGEGNEFLIGFTDFAHVWSSARFILSSDENNFQGKDLDAIQVKTVLVGVLDENLQRLAELKSMEETR